MRVVQAGQVMNNNSRYQTARCRVTRALFLCHAQTIHEKLNVPLTDMQLSRQPDLLTSKTPQVGLPLLHDAAIQSGNILAQGLSPCQDRMHVSVCVCACVCFTGSQTFQDLANPSAQLAQLGCRHGDLIFMLYR